MFKTSKSRLNSLEILHFGDEQGENSFSLIPERGGILTDVCLKSTSVLDGYQTEQIVLENKDFKSCILAPFPNRIGNGKFQFEGKEYQLPINDIATPNALHGLVYDKPFQLISSVCDKNCAQVTLHYTFDGQYSYFPFPFELTVIYTLNRDTGFHTRLLLQNTGTGNMPAGLGWHPYLRLGSSVDALELKLPTVQKINLNQDLLPTGQKESFETFAEKKQIRNITFDTSFLLDACKKDSFATILLSNQTQQISFWQALKTPIRETWTNYDPFFTGSKFPQFGYLQLYTPPSRSSIAIEPMTCSVDAFNNKDGLIILKPSEVLKANCGFSLSNISNR